MSQLERAARAVQDAKINGQRIRFSDEYAAVLARAVIASIEPDDAMVEAALVAYFDDCEDWHFGMAARAQEMVIDSMRAALKAGLRALLAEGEKG
jgi:hypothetical protein